MEEPAKQHRKQYEWLKSYQFVKGQSGNPNGRPPGKSLKTFAREFLESLPDDKKIEYLESLDPEIVWKMAEGMPQSNTDLTSGGKPIPLFDNVSTNNSNKEDKITE